MLLAQRLNKIDKTLQEITQETNTELYAQIDKDLQTIKEALKKEIKHAEKTLENKLISESKEYQDITSTWIKNELNELKPEIKSALDKKADNVLNTLSQTITQSINTQIIEKINHATANLHNQIDLNQIIKNLKNTPSITQEIINNTKAELIQTLNNQLPELKEQSKTQLIQSLTREVDLNQCIKLALDSQTLSTELKAQIQAKSHELISEYLNANNLQNALNAEVETIKQGFLTFINNTKQETINTTNQKITDLNTYLNSVKENITQTIQTHKSELEREKEALKQASQIVINEFDTYLREQKSEVLNNIVTNITTHLNTTEFHSELFQAIKEAGLNEILQQKEAITNEVISEVINQVTEQITEAELYNAILSNEAILNRLENLSTDLLNEKLTHAVIKDFVTESLKDKAKEILKSDELLRAEAEAQAHITAMRLQSNMVSIQDALNALKVEQDITDQLQELANKKQELAQALQEAKDELKQELQATALSDKMQKLITDTLGQELETLKQGIKQENQVLINQLQQAQSQLIQANTQAIEKLKEKLAEIETNLKNGNFSGSNDDGIDNKALATT